MTGRQFATRVKLQDAATSTGNGTPMEVSGLSRIALQVTIATTATVAFEASLDGVNWFAANVTPSTLAASVATASASGLFTCAVAGFAQFRARISSWGSGAVTVDAFGTALAS